MITLFEAFEPGDAMVEIEERYGVRNAPLKSQVDGFLRQVWIVNIPGKKIITKQRLVTQKVTLTFRISNKFTGLQHSKQPYNEYVHSRTRIHVRILTDSIL